MLRYIAVRLISAIPVVFGVTLAVFFMVRLVPGDPVDIMFGNQARPTPEQRAAMRKQLGLDLPIHKQYVKFISDALRGDLGRSFRSKRPVMQEILIRLPNTLKLTAASLAVAVVIGTVTGVLAATFKGSWIDNVSMVSAVLGVSIPGFWLGLMLILLFSVRLGWLPVSGTGTWKHLVLPAFTLGLLSSAILARLTRASMLEALSGDYVRTARAKGLREWWVVIRHALRNALIPIVTMLGLQIGGLLSGAFIIEAVFGYSGIGLLAVGALQTRDFPLIQGIVLMVSLIYVGVNLLVDIIYAAIDPRISYS
ncbi:nickel ABC transporter permease [Sphaerobacter thermophilus]|jgi:ABC-type dipeptide/oligopeptide/nickel transport system permease component|uniref:Binding-protein-dependent transport systems inner membrane component n=1 Tax=Sphaerobacter thermophilus (strain ATCC 49802 / DSM 20745 / KCCM 41009 / NCIMB 13125 / S 6022) TaxID=479434 RepID=D1CAI4_SPHTD|nr:nickel ABC transporter permease [Sphaerobacter thermophilus]ACZ40827.1 binding-protein-dependent transport systems inner membrane component [Sphaerobacter thermophilus DSM 20745]PZN60879.1 MAG: ABC transporter permease [Sphaerobacter thermophilus]